MASELPITNIFEPVCIGRYQIDLPKNSSITGLEFRSFDMVGQYSAHGSSNTFAGNFHGVNRLQNWKLWVKKDKGGSNHKKYIYNKSDKNHHILATHYVFEPKSDPTDMLEIYMLRDFPQIDYSLSFMASIDQTVYIHSKTPNFLPKFNRFVESLPRIARLYQHQPWPHNQLGVCLDKNIVFNTPRAAEDEVYSVIYRYGESSYFEFTFISYAENQREQLREDLNRKMGLLSVFASSAFNFGGHSGRLYVSDHAYSSSASKFRWYATDAKAGSTRNPFISIEGSVDLDDFPEYKDLRNIDADKILIAILSSLRPRENGLVGTK